MRKPVLHFVMLLLAAVSVTASGQSAVSSQVGGFTLEITANLEQGHNQRWDFASTAEKTLKAGTMVVIATRKTNISNHEISKMSETGWIWEVRDSSGNQVGPKSHNLNGPVNFGGPVHVIGTKDDVLQPGETTLDWGDLSQRLDLSRPGTYTFQVSQHTSDDSKSPVVKSNTITITILPAGASAHAQK